MQIDDHDARARYLDEACGDEQKFRLRIEQLLAASDADGSNPLVAVVSQLHSDPDTDAGPATEAMGTVKAGEIGPAVGGMLGRFELIDLIGRGGMGNVFFARDTQLDRPVAIKLPRLDTIGVRGLRDRFLREARMAAKLQHPLLVPILQIGQSGNVLYMASQWCAGGDLGHWIKRHPGPHRPRAVARLMARLCDAVDYCHSEGVLHLDLKPGNILLAAVPDDNATLDQLEIRVTDFGIARMVEQTSCETLSSLALGTPHYMAPELARYNAQPPAATADVYSLGVILHELLYGRRPVEGDDPVEVLSKVRRLDYVTCSPKRDLPRDLRTICGKCLATQPQERYQLVSDLHADLEHFLANRPIAARPRSWASRFLAWCRKAERIRQAGLLAIAQQIGYAFMLPLPLILERFGFTLPDDLILGDWIRESLPLLLFIVLPLGVNGVRTLRFRRLSVLFGCVWSLIPAVLISAVVFGMPSVFSVYHNNPVASFLAHVALAVFGWVQALFYLLAIPAALVDRRDVT